MEDILAETPPPVINETSHPAHSNTIAPGDATAGDATTVQRGSSPCDSKRRSLTPTIATLHLKREMLLKWEIRVGKTMLPTEIKQIYCSLMTGIKEQLQGELDFLAQKDNRLESPPDFYPR
jgi:hypothetical protein